VLSEFTDAEKKEHWRADGYQWRQNGTKKVKCGDCEMQKIFYQVCTVRALLTAIFLPDKSINFRSISFRSPRHNKY